MKRISALLCVLLLLCGLWACNKEEQPSVPEVSSGPAATPEPVKPFAMGLVQFEDNAPQNELREGFMSRLEEYGCDDKTLTVDYRNAGGARSQASGICSDFIKAKAELIVAIGREAAEAAVEASGGSVPVLYIGLEDAAVGGTNVTGVVCPVPADRVLTLAQQANPAIKTVGLLYGRDSKSGSVDAARLWCQQKGLAVVEKTVADPGEAAAVMKELCGQTDAVFSPADGYVVKAGPQLAAEARKAGKPWYTSAECLVRDGAVAAVTVEPAEAAAKAGDMAVSLMAGKDISQVPVYSFAEYRTCLNQTSVSALTLNFPQEALEGAWYYSGPPIPTPTPSPTPEPSDEE